MDSSPLERPTSHSSNNTALFCKFCAHCRLGITYDVPYYRCRFCQLYFCANCLGAHPSSHRQKLLQLVSKEIPPGASRYEKSCQRCSKMVHCRQDCQECGITFCKDCYLSKDCSHQHTCFISFEAPFHSLKLAPVASRQDFCTENTVSHCSRCQCPIDLQQEALKCKTCVATYDDSVNLCQPCYAESWSSHDQSHEVLSLAFRAVENDTQSGLSCRDCHQSAVFLDRATLTRHPHNNYSLHLGPGARESAVGAAFRLCQKKNFRKDQPQVAECGRCKHEFPTQTMRICAGKCEGIFCDECFPLASLSHVHGPTNFRSLNDEACPEIGFLPSGWRAMRNSEGRIYYLQDQTNHFTFEKPRLPPLPAGWVAMVDSRGETVFVHQETNTMSHVSPIFGIAPVGWELRQTQTGRLFYVNKQTNASTWHKPLPTDSKPLPPGWEAAEYSDGRIYYINHFTKTNTWTRPTLPANPGSAIPPIASHLVPNRSVTAPSVRPVSMITPQFQPAAGPPYTLAPTFQASGAGVPLRRPIAAQRHASLPVRGFGQAPLAYSPQWSGPAPAAPQVVRGPVATVSNTSPLNKLAHNPVAASHLAHAVAKLAVAGSGSDSSTVDYTNTVDYTSTVDYTGTVDYTSTVDYGSVDYGSFDDGNPHKNHSSQPLDPQSSGTSDAQSGLNVGLASESPGYDLIEAPMNPAAGTTAPVATTVKPATTSNGHDDDLDDDHPPHIQVLVNNRPGVDGSPSAAIDDAGSGHVENTQAGSGKATTLSAFEALMNPRSTPTSESQSTVGGSFDFSDSTLNCDSPTQIA